MKIQILSDLHREFHQEEVTQDAEADVIVLAGDIAPGIKGVEWAQNTFTKPVIYVAGNHEHYDQEYFSNTESLREASKGSHVHFLENDSVEIDGYRFLGCTFWTDFSLYQTATRSMVEARKRMQDYTWITYGEFVFRPEDSVHIHKESLTWLKAELGRCGEENSKTVVVTHHLPSASSINTQYLGDALNPAFASGYGKWIADSRALLWIHGHTHTPCDYTQGSTRVVCNPLGYPRENSAFERAKVVTI